MDTALVKRFLDSCYNAKRIIELMPKLPAGMSPRHIQVIGAVCELGSSGEAVRVSDVSEYFNVTRPSITKLINELEDMGAVNKSPDPGDRRVIHVSLTELGEQYYDFHIRKYHAWIAGLLSEIDEEHFRIAAEMNDRVYEILSTQKMEDHLK